MLQESQNELKELLEKNITISEETREMIKSIKRFIFFQKIMSVIYFLIIVVPIILSVIYLPTILKKITDKYSYFFPFINPELENVLKFGTAVPGNNSENLKYFTPSEIQKFLPKK